MAPGVGGDRGRRLLAFLGISALGPVLAAVALRTGVGDVSPLASGLVVAAAMPAPLLAALMLDRRSPREMGRDLGVALRRRPAATLVPPIVGLLVWHVAVVLLVGLLGDLGGANAAGSLLRSASEVEAELATQVGADAAAAAGELPPPGLLLAAGPLAGVAAGLTLNGLLAFGEEQGWRGWLHAHLAEQHGHVAVVLLTGLAWGLWHAPLIVGVGFNYPEAPVAGVGAMVVFTTAMSWPLLELRLAGGSALAPAVLHGALNGTAGVHVLALGGDPLLGAPAGLLGAAAWLPVGWLLRHRRLSHEADDHGRERTGAARAPSPPAGG